MPEWNIGALDEIRSLVGIRGQLVATPATMIPGIGPGAAFAAGDAFGTLGHNPTDIDGRPLPKHGIIVGARLFDLDDDVLAATVHVFKEPLSTLQTDNAALAIAAIDALHWITSISFATSTDIGSAKVSEVMDWNSVYAGLKDGLRWQFSTGGTPNIAAGLQPYVQFFIMPLDATGQ